MNNNHAQLHQAVECLESMYRSMASLKTRLLEADPYEFALMAEGPLEQIRQLKAQIDEYTGESTAEMLGADVWLHIEGAGAPWAEVPASTLAALLDSLREGVQAVAEYLATGQLPTRLKVEVRKACDFRVIAFRVIAFRVIAFRVIAFRVGNIQIGMDLPTMLETPLDLHERLAHQALEEYLDVAAWASSEDGLEALDQRISDQTYRYVLLSSLMRLAPRGTIDVLEISGRAVKGRAPIRLTRDIHARIDHAMNRNGQGLPETDVGELRKIDLVGA